MMMVRTERLFTVNPSESEHVKDQHTQNGGTGREVIPHHGDIMPLLPIKRWNSCDSKKSVPAMF